MNHDYWVEPKNERETREYIDRLTRANEPWELEDERLYLNPQAAITHLGIKAKCLQPTWKKVLKYGAITLASIWLLIILIGVIIALNSPDTAPQSEPAPTPKTEAELAAEVEAIKEKARIEVEDKYSDDLVSDMSQYAKANLNYPLTYKWTGFKYLPMPDQIDDPEALYGWRDSVIFVMDFEAKNGFGVPVGYNVALVLNRHNNTYRIYRDPFQ